MTQTEKLIFFFIYIYYSVTLPTIDMRRSDQIVHRRHHQMNYSSTFSSNKVNILSTIPEKSKSLGVRGESPADSSSTEGVIKKPRGEI